MQQHHNQADRVAIIITIIMQQNNDLQAAPKGARADRISELEDRCHKLEKELDEKNRQLQTERQARADDSITWSNKVAAREVNIHIFRDEINRAWAEVQSTRAELHSSQKECVGLMGTRDFHQAIIDDLESKVQECWEKYWSVAGEGDNARQAGTTFLRRYLDGVRELRRANEDYNARELRRVNEKHNA